MLGKVIKYEFKEMKFILVAAAIGVAVITAIALFLEVILLLQMYGKCF